MGYGDLQSLSLSMSPGSQSSCVTAAAQQLSHGGADFVAMDTKKRGGRKVGQKQPVHRKSIDTFGQRTSQYRGVTWHRWTGRYEAHLWDNSCKKEGQNRKGRKVYLGGYDIEEKAARAYDLAALKYWGPSTHINFPLDNYHGELEEMKNMSRQEYVAHLKRKSSGFSRGASMYRGVTRSFKVVQQRLLLSASSHSVITFLPMLGKIIFQKQWNDVLAIHRRQEEIFVPLIQTASTSLQWIMANLVKHQDVQANLVEEIDQVVGDGREDIEEEDLQRMSYLKAVTFYKRARNCWIIEAWK